MVLGVAAHVAAVVDRVVVPVAEVADGGPILGAGVAYGKVAHVPDVVD